jgi:hypothetical protein
VFADGRCEDLDDPMGQEAGRVHDGQADVTAAQGQHNFSAGGNYLLGSAVRQYTRHGSQRVGAGWSGVTRLDS